MKLVYSYSISTTDKTEGITLVVAFKLDYKLSYVVIFRLIRISADLTPYHINSHLKSLPDSSKVFWSTRK